MELTHAGPKGVARAAELRRPSGVVCSDLVIHCLLACAFLFEPTFFGLEHLLQSFGTLPTPIGVALAG
jgi:hypothetical protein